MSVGAHRVGGRRGFAWILLCLFLYPTAGDAAAQARDRRRERRETRARIAARMTYDETIRVGGVARTYKAHVPPSHDGRKPVPLVIVLHGGMGTAYGVDDVGFIAAMIDDLAKKVAIDRQRVYATGLSNGAMMCYRLACDLSERIAAIAPIGGPDATKTCALARPVSVIHFHGVADPCSPFGGGPGGGCAAKALGLPGRPIFDTPSIPDIVKAWGARLGAPAEPRVTLRKGAVTCTTYGPGREGAEAILCAIEGGGHTWPGGNEGLAESLVGDVNRDISTNEAMWEFFQRHARP